MKVQSLCLCLFMLVLGGSEAGTVNGTGDLAAKCNQLVQNVIPCLNFATGNAAVPTKDCCDASSKIKDRDPECLCYLIQQTHKGSPEVKSMGIQETRLLQLPTACNMKNASTTHCPKLLGLSPNSPDAAIFMNASLGTATASTVGTTTPNSKDSFGSKLRPPLIAVAWSILLVMIPTGLVSIYS
ncbi:non-specific lipid transfer protein GPI-anchored 1-like [Gastrolobium bilobum]|uniref:non-specific lipid transfer protein GPI-anchored 1-like n=1 Tax=Gastrolobium bilobum TaxID=150636 RepID=UPI002AB2982E|nr:non-specific lipid transfer protein GPI-anchored 1-like [Gastrolobium bilobum]